jgi:hypothetical protein
VDSDFLQTHTAISDSWAYTPYAYERDIYISKISNTKNILYITSTFENWIFKSYIDWIKILESNFKSKLLWNSDWNLLIWARSPNGNLFNWLIDDVKIYNRAMTSAEIRQQAKSAWF